MAYLILCSFLVSWTVFSLMVLFLPGEEAMCVSGWLSAGHSEEAHRRLGTLHALHVLVHQLFSRTLECALYRAVEDPSYTAAL